MVTVKDPAKQKHLSALFELSDGLAWERLREQKPELAERVQAAVAAGVEKDDIWDYARLWGYSPQITAWLAQAATHLWHEKEAALRHSP